MKKRGLIFTVVMALVLCAVFLPAGGVSATAISASPSQVEKSYTGQWVEGWVYSYHSAPYDVQTTGLSEIWFWADEETAENVTGTDWSFEKNPETSWVLDDTDEDYCDIAGDIWICGQSWWSVGPYYADHTGWFEASNINDYTVYQQHDDGSGLPSGHYYDCYGGMVK
ncbi:hypothetical protein ACFLTL_02710 [Chloroflexota bacterium]